MPAAKTKKSSGRSSSSKTSKASASRGKTSSGRKSAASQKAAQQKPHREAAAIVLFAVALLLAAVIFIPGVNVWRWFHTLFFGLFGLCAYIWPPVLLYIAVAEALDRTQSPFHVKLWQSLGLITLLCAAVQVFTIGKFPDGGLQAFATLYNKGVSLQCGGVIGGLIGGPLCMLFGKTGAAVIIFLLIFVFALLVTGVTLKKLFSVLASPFRHRKSKDDGYFEDEREIPFANEPAPAKFSHKKPSYNIDVDLGPDSKGIRHTVKTTAEATLEAAADAAAPQTKEQLPEIDTLVSKISEVNSLGKPAPREPVITLETKDGQQQLYSFPPVTLLTPETPVSAEDVSEELKSNAARLVDTLRSFGVETRITDICRGPAVTRYELQPSAGVKISRITSLADDIALNLAAAGVRIEAPIPNKSAVGIEVPNKTVSMVHIREIIDSREFRDAQSKLTIALGKDIAGNVAVADVAKMPHMLIAGATGSGKSVCINTIIMSLLYKGTPDEVKFLMVDPKVVELGVYNGIPHLLVPVVTDPRKAAGALGWAVTHMLERYKTFAENNVRDMKGYNALARKTEGMTPYPHIVIIIDELADLMMAAPNEVEDAICRLAQMARAAGMHLVIATQRPSVDVITGVIKANIPSRIAFAVSSQVDSRTILDSGGAEKLLGRGDMLFLPVGASKPVRVQGCFVSDNEVEAVIDYIKSGANSEYSEDIMDEIEKQAVGKDKSGGSEESGAGDADPMLPQAIECVVEAGMASTSLLQRRLKLGYARAARIIDEMEGRGIVGPFEGSKPRQVLITRQQYIEMTMNNEE